jgi:hypothetical protein
LRVLITSQSASSVQLSADEALLLNNALNEALNGISLSEFQTRLGVTPAEAQQLLREFGQLLDKMK